MMLRNWFLATIASALWLAAGSTAWGVIERPLPLKSLVGDSDYVFAGNVTSVDPNRPSLVLELKNDVKGKAPMRRLAVLLKGDGDSGKEQLLPRLAAGTEVVGFITIHDADDDPNTPNPLIALLYFEGTWIQLQGTPAGDAHRWQYTHVEPYLRRTFAGRSSELADLVTAALAEKKPWPEVQTSMKPGLGPTIGEPGNPVPTDTAAANPEKGATEEHADAKVPQTVTDKADPPTSFWPTRFSWWIGFIVLVVGTALWIWKSMLGPGKNPDPPPAK